MVFLSYAKPDIKHAMRLYDALNYLKIDIWFDEVSLLPGKHWKIEIHNAIKRCDYFLALFSKNAVDRRGYVQAELMMALSVLDEVPLNQIFIIPARINNCSVYHPRLQDIQWINLFPDWDSSVDKIIKIVT